MNTKERIAYTALHLFNNQGVTQTSIRDIAQALSISPGNLGYHFKTTESIIIHLYHEMVKEMDALITPTEHASYTISHVITLSTRTFQVFQKYRFLMLDFVQLMRAYPNLKEAYATLMERRHTEMQMLFSLLAAEGILRKEQFKGQFELLLDQLTIVADFWLSWLATQGIQDPEVELKKVTSVFYSMLYPYIEKKHRDEWLSLTGLD